MALTPELGLTLLEGAQAQKHVTVNDALQRLDALARLRLQSVSETDPPGSPTEGHIWGVPTGATGAWAGQAGMLALRLNGGWEFVTPREGWLAWVIDVPALAMWRTSEWTSDALLAGGARLQTVPVTAEIELASGTVIDSSPIIPANGHVQALSGRVIEAVTGTATFSVGFAGGSPDADFFAAGVTAALGSTWAGMTFGQPFYAATPVRITSEGGAFTGGRVRVAGVAVVSIPPTA